LPGHLLSSLGKKLCGALRHQEQGLDAAGFAPIDEVSLRTKIPVWQVLAVGLFNYDFKERMYRFEIHVSGLPGRGQLWRLDSPDMPLERGTAVHIRATRKHSIALGY
jgi:hypothetical protein